MDNLQAKKYLLKTILSKAPGEAVDQILAWRDTAIAQAKREAAEQAKLQ